MKNLKLKLRNNRDYIHGTDIFNLLVRERDYNLIDLKFKKPLNYIPKFLNSKNTKDIAVDCILKKKQIRKIFIGNSRKKVRERYFIDENIPKKNITLTKNSIKCDYETKLTPIEILVSLTKILHKKKFTGKKIWFFTRILLNKNFSYISRKKFKIEIEQNYKDISTVSKIYEYNKIIGLINFTCG
jgi:hypothetical protein